MTPFMIPQVFLIKSLIRELSSRGLAGIACLIIAYGIIEVSFFSVVSGCHGGTKTDKVPCSLESNLKEYFIMIRTIKLFGLKGSRRQFKKSQAVNDHGVFLYTYI